MKTKILLILFAQIFILFSSHTDVSVLKGKLDTLTSTLGELGGKLQTLGGADIQRRVAGKLEGSDEPTDVPTGEKEISGVFAAAGEQEAGETSDLEKIERLLAEAKRREKGWLRNLLSDGWHLVKKNKKKVILIGLGLVGLGVGAYVGIPWAIEYSKAPITAEQEDGLIDQKLVGADRETKALQEMRKKRSDTLNGIYNQKKEEWRSAEDQWVSQKEAIFSEFQSFLSQAVDSNKYSKEYEQAKVHGLYDDWILKYLKNQNLRREEKETMAKRLIPQWTWDMVAMDHRYYVTHQDKGLVRCKALFDMEMEYKQYVLDLEKEKIKAELEKLRGKLDLDLDVGESIWNGVKGKLQQHLSDARVSNVSEVIRSFLNKTEDFILDKENEIQVKVKFLLFLSFYIAFTLRIKENTYKWIENVAIKNKPDFCMKVALLLRDPLKNLGIELEGVINKLHLAISGDKVFGNPLKNFFLEKMKELEDRGLNKIKSLFETIWKVKKEDPLYHDDNADYTTYKDEIVAYYQEGGDWDTQRNAIRDSITTSFKDYMKQFVMDIKNKLKS